MTKFSKAIVKRPAKTLLNGITTAQLGAPDYHNALVQHTAYIEALQQTGLEVRVLDADNDYPDSVFIEDAALLTSQCAIMSRPGAQSRRGETQSLTPTIQNFYQHSYTIDAPGTLDAGDVMMVDDHFFIGLSERTNQAGARQLIDYLETHGMSGCVVEMNEVLHLKTGLSYLQHNNLIISGEFITNPLFANFNQLIVDADEAYAANCVWINDFVLVPAGYPETSRMIQGAGYQVIELDMSEFRKLDGGLSCLSLRF